MENNTQRLVNALKHKNSGRPPVTGLMTAVTVDLMDLCGVYWPDAHSDAEKMVKLAAAAFEFYGLESMKLPFDMTVEAEGLGGNIDFGTKSQLPQMKTHLFDDPAEFLFGRELLEKGRIPLVLNAVEIAKKRYNNIIPVVSSIVGPFTLGTTLFGIENMMIWMIEEPEIIQNALELTTDLCIMYAKEQENAGSDIIQIGEAACSGDLISGDDYGRYIAPCHKKLCAEIKIPTVVHICGNITSHLKYIKNTGMSGISMDIKTDIAQAVDLLKGNTAIIGYVPVLEILRDGTPEQVFEMSRECIKSGVDVLNAGCAWSSDIKGENICEMIKAAKLI
ncbi:MAG: MtaA/CmuA family methyltransferase [Oscillospiraceae bacterium]|nr:MtaA/CmuA family methyltransferase [Oscillospiraceae bacterium]